MQRLIVGQENITRWKFMMNREIRPVSQQQLRFLIIQHFKMEALKRRFVVIIAITSRI